MPSPLALARISHPVRSRGQPELELARLNPTQRKGFRSPSEHGHQHNDEHSSFPIIHESRRSQIQLTRDG
jgi:hypothetical protein